MYTNCCCCQKSNTKSHICSTGETIKEFIIPKFIHIWTHLFTSCGCCFCYLRYHEHFLIIDCDCDKYQCGQQNNQWQIPAFLVFDGLNWRFGPQARFGRRGGYVAFCAACCAGLTFGFSGGRPEKCKMHNKARKCINQVRNMHSIQPQAISREIFVLQDQRNTFFGSQGLTTNNLHFSLLFFLSKYINLGFVKKI